MIKTELINIYGLNKEELENFLTGEPKYRTEQIYKALHKGTAFEKINIPGELKQKIAKDFYVRLPEIVKEHISSDGTRKFLLKLHDGSLIETVLLIQDYGNTVCVSSQVGCKMACAFCASGRGGFIRNLTAGEMLSQVILLNKLSSENGKVSSENSPVSAQINTENGPFPSKISSKNSPAHKGISHIVIMGSGEPFDNFDSTIKFLNLAASPDGINIGARNISVSTAGIVPKIREFADLKLQINLCISLHAPNDEIRRNIMPIAKAYPIAELIAAAKYFFEKTKRRVIFEYSLIDGVNCSPENALELSKLLRGFPNHVNLINLNRTPEGKLQPPPRTAALKFMDTLIKSGTSCTMRKSRGDDIAAACGQLRNLSVSKN